MTRILDIGSSPKFQRLMSEVAQARADIRRVEDLSLPKSGYSPYALVGTDLEGNVVAAEVAVLGSNPSRSADSTFINARSVDDTIPGNGHAFTDSAVITRGGVIGYNSFDARFLVSGDANYDHFASFQSIPEMGTTGTTLNVYGLYAGLILTAGTVNTSYGLKVANPVGAGAVGVAYGVHVSPLTKAGSYYGIFQEGAGGFNILQGKLGVGNFADGAALAAAFHVAGDALVEDGLTVGRTGVIAALRSHSGANSFRIYQPDGGQIFVATNAVRVMKSSTSTDTMVWADTHVAANVPLRSKAYTVATLPSAATSGASAMVYVSDEVGGAVLAFSDGANWRRVTDRAIVS